MSNRLFFCVRQPCSRLPAGVVVVEAPKGVRLELLDARVHVGLVVVADVEHVVVAVDGAGERLQADVRRAAVAGETHHGDVLGRHPLGAQARLDAREHRRRGRKGRDHRVVAEGQLREVEAGGAHAAGGQRRHRMGAEHLERLAHGQGAAAAGARLVPVEELLVGNGARVHGHR